MRKRWLGNDRRHLRLLQHDFRQPDAVSIARPLPGQIVAARWRLARAISCCANDCTEKPLDSNLAIGTSGDWKIRDTDMSDFQQRSFSYSVP